MAAQTTEKKELFESMPIPKALATLAVPTIISQMISVIYNMVDTFYIGRAGNPFMLAATSLSLSVMLLNISFANLFGIGGGSLMARLMGQQKMEDTKSVCSFSVYGAAAVSIIYSAIVGCFLHPLLRFLGASEDTIGFASQYTFYVVVIVVNRCVINSSVDSNVRRYGISFVGVNQIEMAHQKEASDQKREYVSWLFYHCASPSSGTVVSE